MLTGNSFMTDKFMPMSQAIEGYDIFNKMQVQKVVFVPEHQQNSLQICGVELGLLFTSMLFDVKGLGGRKHGVRRDERVAK